MKFVLIAVVVIGVGVQRKTLISGDDILKNVEKGIEGVQDFIVSIDGDINMERLRVPRTTATMYYKRPDKVHFDSPSFAIIPRDGVMLDPTALRQRYNAITLGEDTLGGRKVFRLQLAARDMKTRLRQLFLWVDPGNWTIAKAEASPYEGRLFTIEFWYDLQAEKFWLVSKAQAKFGVTTQDVPPSKVENTDISKPMIDEMQRAPRTGAITLTYSNYRINTNLSDEIFQSKEVK